VLLQRCAGRNAFLEELIVRGSLADNFCYYQPHYDSVDAAPQWAQQSLHDLEQRHKRSVQLLHKCAYSIVYTFANCEYDQVLYFV
jgi:hypothetical protein